MSIMLSTIIRGSVSIAEIPQLDIANYWYTHWDLIRKYCFNSMSEEEIREKYGHRIGVIELFKKENYIPKCFFNI